MPHEYFNVTSPAEFVVQVEIDRPKKLNAFTEQMFQDLGAIFNQLSHDPDVRAVILTGNGDRAFTAGLDVQAASESGGITRSVDQDPARRAVAIRRHILEMQDPMYVNCPLLPRTTADPLNHRLELQLSNVKSL